MVGAVERFDGPSALLEGGERREPDAVIAATGFRPGLEQLVGHLGVLDEEGEPVLDARAADGLFFAGFRFGLLALLPYIEGDARRIARAVGSEPGLERLGFLRRPLKIKRTETVSRAVVHRSQAEPLRYHRRPAARSTNRSEDSGPGHASRIWSSPCVLSIQRSAKATRIASSSTPMIGMKSGIRSKGRRDRRRAPAAPAVAPESSMGG